MIARAYRNWRSRHLNRTSLALHVAGIPACFLVAPVLLILHCWLAGAISFVGGYVLQFVGHAIEGNRSGEELLLRRLLGGKERSAASGDDGLPPRVG
jgi:uncharacterized membrane protein YGL010W